MKLSAKPEGVMERMALLLLHGFAGQRVPYLTNPAVELQDQIWEEVPRVLVPLQERMQRERKRAALPRILSCRIRLTK